MRYFFNITEYKREQKEYKLIGSILFIFGRLKIILPILLFSIISGCSNSKKIIDPYQHIGDKKVIETLKKSYKALGGIENWNNIKELHYDKHATLLLESGEVESDIFQFHDYFYLKKEINISWKDTEGRKQKITSTNGNALKFVGGILDKNAKTASLNTSVTTSLFVVSVPFKMLDKGVILSHEGTDVLEDGQKVEVIKATYNPSQNSHHSTPDIWWYYFDNQDFKLVAYMVKHADHYSYVKNTSYTKSEPFTFPATRESYRVDKDRNILYTRAKYKYDNYLVKR